MKLEKAKDYCNQWLPAWTGNKPELLISFYSEDAFYSDPFIPKGLKGNEQIFAYFRKFISYYPNWKYEQVDNISDGKWIYVEMEGVSSY